MRFSARLNAQHLDWMFKKHWQIQRKRVPTETSAVSDLEVHGIRVKDVEDVIKPKLEKLRLDFGGYMPVLTPEDESHPNWHSQKCHMYGSANVLLEGVKQAQVLTNTIEINGFPKVLEDSIKKMQIPSSVDRHIQQLILSSHILDAEQVKLPKIKLTDRPAFNLPRDYGISHQRKNRLLINRFIAECEKISGRSISLRRRVLDQVDFKVTIQKGDDILQFSITAEKMLTSSKPIEQIAVKYAGELPDLYPMKDTISMPKRNIYTTETFYHVVELLVVFEEDFEQILRPVMEQQWIDKKNAIMALDYFNFFTRAQLTDAYKLCVLRQFEPLETICYEDKGQLSYVHFVISGECMILQCLQMVISQRKEVKNYYLTNIIKDSASLMFQDITDTQFLQSFKTESVETNKNISDIDELIASDNNIRRRSTPKVCNASDRKIENHFIDVGSLTFGSIFGLGEKFEHRVIMARTTVQCLMIPRFWLLEKDQNPGNIWQRRRFYLDSTIPSRQTLFNDFLNTRHWQKFKSDLIQRNLKPNSILNPTHVEDIPIICQIVEASDE